MFTHSNDIATRHQELRDELKSRLADTGKWTGLPRLLDDLHALKHQHEEAVAHAKGSIRNTAPV